MLDANKLKTSPRQDGLMASGTSRLVYRIENTSPIRALNKCTWPAEEDSPTGRFLHQATKERASYWEEVDSMS